MGTEKSKELQRMEELIARAKAGENVKPPSLREFWRGLKAIVRGE
jgi:hypothetical protein